MRLRTCAVVLILRLLSFSLAFANGYERFVLTLQPRRPFDCIFVSRFTKRTAPSRTIKWPRIRQILFRRWPWRIYSILRQLSRFLPRHTAATTAIEYINILSSHRECNRSNRGIVHLVSGSSVELEGQIASLSLQPTVGGENIKTSNNTFNETTVQFAMNKDVGLEKAAAIHMSQRHELCPFVCWVWMSSVVAGNPLLRDANCISYDAIMAF